MCSYSDHAKAERLLRRPQMEDCMDVPTQGMTYKQAAETMLVSEVCRALCSLV